MAPNTGRRSALYDFKVARVWRRAHDVAVREAMLFPLMAPQEKKRSDGAVIARLTQALVQVRRAKFYNLRAVGCLRAKRSGIFMLNCPPCSVTTGDKARVCGWSRWCPHCWGREHAGETYERFCSTLFPADRPDELREVTFTRSHLVSGGWMRLLPPDTDLQTTARFLQDTLGSFRTHLDVRGAVALASLEPHGDSYLAWQRFLAIVPPDDSLPIIPGPGEGLTFELRRRHRVTRLRTAYAVSEVCRYPTQLFHGKPQQITACLTAMEGRRLSRYYGCARRSHFDLEHMA